MSLSLKNLTLILLCSFISGFAYGEEKPDTGKAAADKYFKPKAKLTRTDHYMAVQLGFFSEGTAYKWGLEDKVESVGKWTGGVTYRFDEWGGMDTLFRVELGAFELEGEKMNKLSFMPVLAFPEASSEFPLYFGIGGGLGVFFKQINNESSLSIDYQVLVGARFFNILDSIGFLVEAGLKNHLHILSDGQFNGVFFSAGTLFVF